MSSELSSVFYDARIVGVISNAIKEKRYVMVVGPRDVGKSLYMRLVAAKLINCSWEGDVQTSRENIGEGKKEEDYVRCFVPIFVSCNDAAHVARLNYTEFMYQGRKIKLEPVIFIDDAHLCKEVEVDKGRVVRIYPTQHYMQRSKGNSAELIYVYPFRFVEVAELVGYPIPEIRKVLSDIKHYRGKDRSKNLINPESICKIINSLYQKIPETPGLSGLDKLFRLYALYGGTAYGIELIYRALHSTSRKDELGHVLGHVLGNYMETIDKVLEDAKALGVDEVATKYLLYYLSDIGGERKGLEVDLNKMYESVVNKVARRLGVNINIEKEKNREKNNVVQAYSYLKDSLIVTEFSKSKEKSTEEEEKKEEGALYKVFFTDPRYFLGAYLRRYAEEEPEHHVSVFMDHIEPCILGKDNEGCDWVPYYFEGLALLNVALGVYATNASNYKQRYPERFDKYLRYIKQKNELEIDGQFKIKVKEGDIKVLFEVSMSYDKDHVNKCEWALEEGLGNYCIYAVLNYGSIECKNVNNRYIIIAPLSLVLLLF